MTHSIPCWVCRAHDWHDGAHAELVSLEEQTMGWAPGPVDLATRKPHVHNPNQVIHIYRCPSGHEIHIAGYMACWCGWTRNKK